MAKIATLFLVLLVIAIVAIKLWAANRRAARLAAEAAERARQRAAMEKEILERLGRLQKRDDRELANRAASEDPERAARIVGKMMRKD